MHEPVLKLAPSLSADFRDESSTNHAFLKELGCDTERIDECLLEVVVFMPILSANT